MGWFSKKVLCDQCDKKTAKKSTLRKRGFMFCSEACRDSWAAEHPPEKATGGTTDQYREQAEIELKNALHELGGVIAANGGDLGGVSASAALDALEAAQDGMSKFGEHLGRALPYLYALGFEQDAERLEDFDTMQIFEMTKAGSGPLQQRKIRQIVEPVFKASKELLGRL